MNTIKTFFNIMETVLMGEFNLSMQTEIKKEHQSAQELNFKN